MTVIIRFFYAVLLYAKKLVLKLVSLPSPVLLLGPGAALRLCDQVAQLGSRKILIITDRPLVELGMIEPIMARLEERGVSCTVFDGIQPDPTFAIVEAGIAALHAGSCDGVLAIGGGSSIDAAKVVALAAGNGVAPVTLIGNLKAKTASLPFFAIPTTAGTGSEATLAAVISDTATHGKEVIADPKVVPIAAALDPELTLKLPSAIAAATGMDAMTHAIESYISDWATDDTRRLSVAAVDLIFRNLQTCCEPGDDLAAREAMLLASYYAGCAFTRALVGNVHAVSHQLGGRYGTPHGLGNAIFLPPVLDHALPAATGRLATLARAIGMGGAGDSEESLARALVGRIRELNSAIGIPEQLDSIRREDVPDIARDAIKEAYGYPVPRLMSQEDCESMLLKVGGL